MYYRLVFIFGWLTLSLAFSPLSAQVVSPILPGDTLYEVPLPGDTLPAIRMKFEPLFLIPIVVIPAAALFLGGHSYQINGTKRFDVSAVKPYFQAAHSQLLTDLHNKNKRNRIIWYGATGTGVVVITVGFMRRISFAPFFFPIPLYDSSNDRYLFWGAGLMVAGIAARIVCFRQLRKAVNYYNFEYAGKKPSVGLHLGLPSATPAGLALYLKF